MAEGERFPWPGGARAAVSLSFDDARASQIETGLPILNRHGVRATFYLSPRNAEFHDHLPGWRQARQQGHEMGNHTLNHPCSGNFLWSRNRALEDYTVDRMTAEFRDADAAIADALGVTPTTFAYPCGQTNIGRGETLQSYIPLVARRFLAGRGFMAEYANDPTFCDLAHLGGLWSDNRTFAWLQEAIEGFIAATPGVPPWIVFAGHDVGPAARQTFDAGALDALCGWLKDPATNIWVDTVATVASHIKLNRKS